MQSFQSIVLGVAFLLLIVLYIVIIKTTLSKKTTWPTSYTMCPDYWEYDSSTFQCKYKNFNRGDANSSEIIDLKEMGSSLCDKYLWLMNHGYKSLSWEGITYGVNLNDCISK
jgi:hypothetical protein